MHIAQELFTKLKACTVDLALDVNPNARPTILACLRNSDT
jgi:hypothetical protein